MPQLVPPLMKFTQAPKLNSPPPSQSTQDDQGDGQTFADTLDEAKSRTTRKPADDGNPPAKVQPKKEARPTKSAGKGDAVSDPKAKETRTRDPDAAQDDTSQSDSNAKDSDEPKTSKQAVQDKPSSHDPPEVPSSAAIVQLQTSQIVTPKTSSSPEDDKSDSNAPARTSKTAVVRPVAPKLPDEAKTKDTRSDATTEEDADAKATPSLDAQSNAAAKPGAAPQPAPQATPARKPPLVASKGRQGAADDSQTGQSPDTQAAIAAAAQVAADGPGEPDGQATADADSQPKSVAKLSIDDIAGRCMPQPDSAPAKPTGGADRAAPSQPAAPSPRPEVQFAESNHAKIVSGIQGQLLPNGGSMHIRLDPPELGALSVRVEMRDGVMTAAFETSNDQATKLLSHSLGELKMALEGQGVSVEKLHVRQSSQHQTSSGDDHRGERQQDPAAQREQQRRDLMRRMWRRLMKGQDPLDLVA